MFKSFLLSLIIMLGNSIAAFAIEFPTIHPMPTYEPILKLGRVWNTIEHDGYGMATGWSCKYSVIGDTIVDGKDWFVVLQEGGPIPAPLDENMGKYRIIVREDAGKIVFHTCFDYTGRDMFEPDEHDFLFLDMTHRDGTILNVYPFPSVVVNVDSVEVMGMKHRCLHLVPQPNSWWDHESYWIEGIGFVDDFYVAWWSPIPQRMDYPRLELLSAYDGDTLIFDRSQFEPAPLVGISNVSADAPSHPPLYFSIDGRRLPNRNGARIMIKDGKKYLLQ